MGAHKIIGDPYIYQLCSRRNVMGALKIIGVPFVSTYPYILSV